MFGTSRRCTSFWVTRRTAEQTVPSVLCTWHGPSPAWPSWLFAFQSLSLELCRYSAVERTEPCLSHKSKSPVSWPTHSSARFLGETLSNGRASTQTFRRSTSTVSTPAELGVASWTRCGPPSCGACCTTSTEWQPTCRQVSSHFSGAVSLTCHSGVSASKLWETYACASRERLRMTAMDVCR